MFRNLPSLSVDRLSPMSKSRVAIEKLFNIQKILQFIKIFNWQWKVTYYHQRIDRRIGAILFTQHLKHLM